jgi:endonuclease/exonuclease/phosphatase family metal-dependent hydrolase
MIRPLRMLMGVLAAGISLLSAGASAQGSEAALRVMSFNVRLPLARDGANGWEQRRALLVQTIATEQPDIIGTQELHKIQGDYIVANLPQYAWFGIDRRGAHADEHMGIFYNRNRLVPVETGNFWLSDAPDIPGSISWSHPFPRMVTWALMETLGSKRRFYIFNTHLPFRAGDEEARINGARLLLQRVEALPADVPVVVTGDFNTQPGGPVYAMLTQSLADVRVIARQVDGPDGTFHQFTGVPMRRIDWILTRGLTPLRAATIAAPEGGPYRSDHFPVTAQLEWPTSVKP